MKKFLLALGVLAFSQVSFAANDCFDVNFVSGWNYDSATDAVHVYEFSTTWEVKTLGCFQLAWANTIGFESFFGTQVCRGDKLIVFDSFGDFVEKCHIQSVTKLQE